MGSRESYGWSIVVVVVAVVVVVVGHDGGILPREQTVLSGEGRGPPPTPFSTVGRRVVRALTLVRKQRISQL